MRDGTLKPVERKTLDTQESADYLGLNEATVRRKIKAGILPAVKIRGSNLWRISIADLDALVQKQRK